LGLKDHLFELCAAGLERQGLALLTDADPVFLGDLMTANSQANITVQNQENHTAVRRHYKTKIDTTNFFELRVVQWNILQ